MPVYVTKVGNISRPEGDKWNGVKTQKIDPPDKPGNFYWREFFSE